MSPSPRISAESMIDGVRQSRQSHHDTLYVTKRQHRRLKQHVSVGGLRSGSIDSLRIAGLDVEARPVITRPIVCQKGEVFPLAKDWKNDESERLLCEDCVGTVDDS
jgi:hypothetical protein